MRWFSLRERKFSEKVFHLSIIAFGRRNGSSEQRARWCDLPYFKRVGQSCGKWSATNELGAANFSRRGKIRGGLEAAEPRQSEGRAPVLPWVHNPTACCATIAAARLLARESKSQSISFQAWFAPSFLISCENDFGGKYFIAFAVHSCRLTTRREYGRRNEKAQIR